VKRDIGIISRITESVSSLDVEGLRSVLSEAFKSGLSGMDIVSEGIMEGIKLSGDVGLIVASEVLKDEINKVMVIEKQKIKKSSHNFSGKVVIGTVLGDIHDVGKNIVVALMESIGLDVEDLGVNIPPAIFVEKAKLPEVKVIALSCLLSSTTSSIKQIILELEKADIRNEVKIIIGGAGTSLELADTVNADSYAKDAFDGIKIIEKWMVKREL
jgi:5-methyltetrahydrofolate--homocysteine methyltransferase